MSYVKIWIHTVWGTKFHEKILTKEIREILFNHILSNAKQKQIYISCINGYLDHVHCLLALNSDVSISKTIQLIKGESAHWVNKNSLIKNKFEWANEYFAVSVSESMLNKVRDYIKNQEKHHRISTFKNDVDDFMKRYGFSSPLRQDVNHD